MLASRSQIVSDEFVTQNISPLRTKASSGPEMSSCHHYLRLNQEIPASRTGHGIVHSIDVLVIHTIWGIRVRDLLL